MNADAVKDVIYQSCLAMDDERFDEYLSLCTEDYQYKVTAYSPELRKDMIWLEQGRADLMAMFEMLPEHVKPEGRFTRHVQVYRVTPNGSPNRLNVTSALTVYFTTDRGETKVFAIGRYNDVVDTTGTTPRLKAREVRLETRSLGTGSQIPF
jgi:methanesulfonate monooxygenase small subunit